jgi:hypothetical protein
MREHRVMKAPELLDALRRRRCCDGGAVSLLEVIQPLDLVERMGCHERRCGCTHRVIQRLYGKMISAISVIGMWTNAPVV